MLYLVFIILASVLQIIYNDLSIVIVNFLKSLNLPIYLTHYHRHIILTTQSSKNTILNFDLNK